MTENKIEEKFRLELIENVPQHLVDKLKPGDMLLKAYSLHKNFLEQPWQKELADDSDNNRMLWRHRDPEHPDWQGIVYGRNLQETVLDNGFSESYYRVFGGPDGSPYDKMQKLIKLRHELGDPIGISKGFIKHYDKNGEIIRVTALEDSITYKPQCNQCVTQEVIQMEEKEMKEIVEKLQKELNDTKMQLEQKDADIAGKAEALEKLENERKAEKAKLEEIEAKLNSSKDEKTLMEEKFVELSDAFKNFKAETIASRKTPIVNQILEFEDSTMKDALKNVYLGWEVNKLEERLAEVKLKASQSNVITKTLAEERKEAYEKFQKKDVGIGALQGMRDMDLVNEIEKEMKAEGIL